MMSTALLLVPLLATQLATELSLEVRPGLEVDYSDAVLVEVTLEAAGAPVADQRIDFFVRSEAQSISCSPGSLAATDAEGHAGPLRIRFVAGACGVDSWVAGDPDGEPYSLEARFAGNPTHATSSATVTLRLHREAVTVQLLPEHSAALGEQLTLIATLLDGNGDAEESGSGTSGRAPAPVPGATVFFYLDLNDDADFADLDEALGNATTDAEGRAARLFDTTPVAGLPRAGLHRDAVRAEFPGDDRYKFAAGLGDWRLDPAPVDASLSLLEADPAELPADGFSRSEIQVRLRDRFGNLLGPDDAVHNVVLETDLGSLLDSVARDPASGHYGQELEAANRSGTATLKLTVNDQPGPELQVIFTDAGGCDCTTRRPVGATGLVWLAALVWRATRRRRP